MPGTPTTLDQAVTALTLLISELPDEGPISNGQRIALIDELNAILTQLTSISAGVDSLMYG